MSQVRFHNKKTGITYVYEAETYYDKATKKTKAKKKLIGKIDPETGNIVPTGRKGRAPKPKAEPVSSYTDEYVADLKAKLDKALMDVQEKEKQRVEAVNQLRAEKKAFKEYRKRAREAVSSLYAVTDGYPDEDDE